MNQRHASNANHILNLYFKSYQVRLIGGGGGGEKFVFQEAVGFVGEKKY